MRAQSSSSSTITTSEESYEHLSTPPTPSHPFANSKSLLVIIPQDRVDVEEESALYDELNRREFRVCPHLLCGALTLLTLNIMGKKTTLRRSKSPTTVDSRSLISGEIWLGDSSGASSGFSRDVRITGWSNVGDKLGGAYVVYDCAVTTKEGTTFHILKRYSDFVQLAVALRQTLPKDLIHNVPSLPPKSPLSRYRPAFLENRRRRLQHWLSCILLHPDLGGCSAVRQWVVS